MKESSNRNISLDVLRCILMFGVVLQHTFAVCKYGDVIPYAAYIVADCLTHPSVDGFTAISGWFGVRCTLKKLFRLACLIYFCGTLHWLIYEVGRRVCGSYFLSHYGIELNWLPWGPYESYRYWYLGAYIKLMLFTIALNPLFGWIEKLRRGWIWLIAIVFVGGNYLSKLWFPWTSHSPRTIIFVYVVIRFAMMLGFKEAISEKRVVRHIVGWLLAASFVLIAANAYWRLGLELSNYSNPLTILTGILLVGFFSGLKLPDGKFVRICSLFAPSMISVYMLHWNFMETFFKPMPQILLSTIPYLPIVAAFVICAIVIFLLCTVIDLGRRLCLEKSRSHWPKWLLKFV
jgi:peptidoglycan/LPS O-acetylase OafA/YrhL